MVTHVNASSAISARALPSSLLPALTGSGLLPMVPLTVLLPIAGYVWSAPGSAFWAFFIGYVSLVMAGLLAIHARPRRQTAAASAPRGSEQRERSEWRDCIRRLEQVMATLSETPQAASVHPRTLH